MKNHLTKISLIVISITIFIACNAKMSNKQSNPVSTKTVYKSWHVLTKVEQEQLTPELVLKEFNEGNERYKSGNVTQREHSEDTRRIATSGQFPKAMVLSCLDSRVPVEDVFDQGIGDVFVGRVAGNFVNTDLLGSMEFACKVAGAKLIIVMGHQHCGAVKGAIDNVQLGNITAMLQNIRPAVVKSENFPGEKTSKNEAFVKYVAENNIRNTINNIREKSEILRVMEANGQIKIVGVFYTLRTGTLEFIN